MRYGNKLGQFYDLEVAEGTLVYGEADEGAHLVKARDACGTGVDV